MILVGLKLKIENLWACKLGDRFKGAEFHVLDIHPSKEYSRGLLAVDGETELNQVKDFLSSLDNISRVEILVNEPDAKLISFYFEHGLLGEIILKSGVHIRPPLELKDGYIKVNIIGTAASINKFFNDSEKLDKVSMEITRKSELRFLTKSKLTKRQVSILKEAIRLGYYDLPRRIRTSELAEKLNLAPSTLTEHLRKAENRIIKDYL